MNQLNENYGTQKTMTQDMAKSFVSRVFLWMFAALSLTAFTALLFAHSDPLKSLIFSENGISAFGWIVTFAPLIIAITMSARVHKMSVGTTVFLYVIYSVLMGMSLSFIFLAYTQASIFKTFFIAASMFGVMALLGYTTKTDLTKFGSLLFMALIGIIIATLVNFLLGSETLDYIISIVGVLIFTGLTAYDVQKIKQIGEVGINEGESEMMAKITVHAALTLYLDFLNLFLFLLRIFGNRD